MASKGITFAKNGPDGERIERVAYTPADRVKFTFEGFTEQKTKPADKTPAAEKTATEKPATSSK